MKQVLLEVVLPNESRAVCRTIGVSAISQDAREIVERFILERMLKLGWWNSGESIHEFEVAGIRLVLHRKKPLGQ